MKNFFKRSGLAKLDDLNFPKEKINWPEPWWCLEQNLLLRRKMQKALNLEIGPKHPLWGLKPVVIGKTDANDDVIVHLSSQTFACVHLLWTGKHDMFPAENPATEIFEKVSELQLFLEQKAGEYS
ncbi:hypothetical protein L4C34_17715 [Vibrio profundum]|uniref:hypothetical protein n=1 Tax=Vibrio profundum TaxID=2910247 RepID=UPI003D0B9ED9